MVNYQSGGNYEPDLARVYQQQFGAAAGNYAVSGVHAGGPNLDAMVERAALRGTSACSTSAAARATPRSRFATHGARGRRARPDPRRCSTRPRVWPRERGLSNVWFKRGRAEALPFPDGSFDVVTSRFCAHHYADAARATREAARVLRRGGQLLLVDSYSPEDGVQDTFLNAIEVLRDPRTCATTACRSGARMFADAGSAADAGRAAGRARLEFESGSRARHAALARGGLRALIDAAPPRCARRSSCRRRPATTASMPVALVEGLRL